MVVGYAYADWAGVVGEGDLRSCSGGVVFLPGMVLTSVSQVQQTTVLSSCESEFFALTSCSAEILCWNSLLHEIGQAAVAIPECFTDSASALATTGRRGSKRLKHAELRKLVAQEWQKERRIYCRKVLNVEKPADVLTKFLARSELEKMLALNALVRLL